MNRKRFTTAEANKWLPLISNELRQLQQLQREFESCFYDLQQMRAGGVVRGEDPLFPLEVEMEFLQIQIRGGIRQMEQWGVQLKDIQVGLVDFPSLKDGEEILLCWKIDEEEVSHWHYPWEGYYYRKKIDTGEEKGEK